MDNPNPKILTDQELTDRSKANGDLSRYKIDSLEYTRITIFDIVAEIKDPEFQRTLEELDIVEPASIEMRLMDSGKYLVTIWWKPTVAHCSFAS